MRKIDEMPSNESSDVGQVDRQQSMCSVFFGSKREKGVICAQESRLLLNTPYNIYQRLSCRLWRIIATHTEWFLAGIITGPASSYTFFRKCRQNYRIRYCSAPSRWI